MKNTLGKNFLLFSVIFCSILLHSNSLDAQNDIQFNPILFNGRIYTYNPYYLVEGNPFLFDSKFQTGKVFVQGRAYQTLLNFDIVSQKVIIYYPFFTKVSMISIPAELVDSFYFSNRKFIQKKWDAKVVFLEKIGSGSHYLLIKNQKVESIDSSPNHLICSQNIKSLYWWDGKRQTRLKNKRSFLKLMAKSKQKKIKLYWRKNHFKFRSASSEQWQSFITFLNANIY